MSFLFWLVYAGLNAVVIAQLPGETFGGVIGALMIIGSAMFPSYLWVHGKVRGLPIFPGYALTFTWTFALPLIEDHPIVTNFSSWNQFVAAVSVTGFLWAGTAAWYFVVRRQRKLPVVCWGMKDARCAPFFLMVLGLCLLWTVAGNAGWIQLSSGTVSIIRAVQIAAEALTCFVLSYQLGKGKLDRIAQIIFVVLLGGLIVVILPNLLLINAMALVAITCMAYTAASKRLPWRLGIVAFCLFAFLHVGKSRMREKYWHDDEVTTFKPTQYPEIMLEWVETSMEMIHREKDNDDRGESLLERSSLMHWLLYFQASSPGQIPFLSGATYAAVPRMFVPRIFDPEKPISTTAGDMISVHYGIQPPEGIELTHIAFGLVDEAFANFGFTGMLILGGVLGAAYGKVAQWAQGMPILSFRALFAILIASYCFQAEFTSTYFVAAVFQSSVVLVLVGIVAMRPMHLNRRDVSLLD